jgi:hypothetical protein
MGLTFPRRCRGAQDVPDISLLQGRLPGAGELIDGRQDLRTLQRPFPFERHASGPASFR